MRPDSDPGPEARPRGSWRVLFYEPYPMGLGGNFQTQAGFVQQLVRDGAEVIVAAPQEGAALAALRTLGADGVVLPPPPSLAKYGGGVLRSGVLGGVRSAIDLLRYNLQVASFLRSRRIDVVYANCVRAAMSCGLGARLSGTPLLLYVKGALANPLIDRLSLLLAHKVLFFCAANRDDRYPRMIRLIRRKVGILKIGLDPGTVRAAAARGHTGLRSELGLDEGTINTAVIGQLYPPKGQHFAIEALAVLRREIPNLRLYLLGDEVIKEHREYRNELDDLITRLGVGDAVRFTGWRTDVLDVVSQMDIIIHPSLAEGFGRAVLESMALGRPVIASRVGGLREAIRDGENGCLVAPGDVDAIISRWRQLAADPKLRARLGQAATATVMADYLMADKAREFSAALRRLAGAGV